MQIAINNGPTRLMLNGDPRRIAEAFRDWMIERGAPEDKADVLTAHFKNFAVSDHAREFRPMQNLYWYEPATVDKGWKEIREKLAGE